MDKKHWDIPAGTVFINVNLESHTDGSVRSFRAKVKHSSDDIVVSMLIPKSENIPNSDYSITATLDNDRKLERKFEVTIRDNMLHMVHSSSYEFNLDGKGTIDTAYIIATPEDYHMFLWGLSNDSVNHGAGKYFKQTASFTAPNAADSYDGRYYHGQEFAGNYDGGGNTLTIYYMGSNSAADNNCGQFTKLHNGAVVKNLNINAIMDGMNDNCGAIAAESSGVVLIDSVTVNGSIEGHNNVGAFVGHATDSLIVKNSYISANVKGNKCVGGIIGTMDGVLTVDNFKNPTNTTAFVSVSAKDCFAGGIIGSLNGGCSLDRISIIHTTSEEQSSIKAISTGGNLCGGLIGGANVTMPSHIKNCEATVPMSGHTDVGGLIGSATLTNTLELQGCTVGSYITGNTHVGGLIGWIKSDNHLKISRPTGTYSKPNTIGQSGDTYIGINGVKEVGGLFGYMYGGYSADNNSTSININVEASDSIVGGIVGKLEWSTLNCAHFSISASMNVKGSERVGGIVGQSVKATLRGHDYKNYVDVTGKPSSNKFTSDYSGTVTGTGIANQIGGIVGYAQETYLEYLCSDGTVIGTTSVGGIVGEILNNTRGHIYCCASKLKAIDAQNGMRVGGIAGLASMSENSNIKNCVNYGEVSVTCDAVGGLIGYLIIFDSSPVVEKLLNYGKVSGKQEVGGCIALVAHWGSDNKDITLSTMGNFGDISATDGNLGGVLGSCSLKHTIVNHCANHGNVTGGGNTQRVGGVAGTLGHDPAGLDQKSNVKMGYCCNRGTVSSSNKGARVGGVLGYLEEATYSDSEWALHDCYNSGEVTSKQNSDNGGILGYCDVNGYVKYCINWGRVHHGNGVVGTHKGDMKVNFWDIYYLEGSGDGWKATSFSENQRSNKNTFQNFDFNKVWDVNSSTNGGYPYLRNCPFQFN